MRKPDVTSNVRQVWKFAFRRGDPEQTFQMPQARRPVLAGVQGDLWCAWYEVENTDEFENVTLRVYGTGHRIREGDRHVGSFQEDPFVWHVYEVGE